MLTADMEENKLVNSLNLLGKILDMSFYLPCCGWSFDCTMLSSMLSPLLLCFAVSMVSCFVVLRGSPGLKGCSFSTHVCLADTFFFAFSFLSPRIGFLKFLIQ